MRNLIILLACFIFYSIHAQEDNTYTMFQNILLTPKEGQGAQLRAGLKAHNDKYHKEGNQSVNVWAIGSGPRFGSLVWSKGPMTWTHMDTPLDADGHMDDWQTRVAPYATMESMDFWRLVGDMAYMPEGHVPNVLYIRYFDIKNQKGNNSRHIWNSVLKMYRDKNWDIGLQVYNNTVPPGDHRDWAIIWSYDNYASMDKNRQFFATYEETYGIDRAEFFEGWNDASKLKAAEIWTLVPELSVLGSAEE